MPGRYVQPQKLWFLSPENGYRIGKFWNPYNSVISIDLVIFGYLGVKYRVYFDLQKDQSDPQVSLTDEEFSEWHSHQMPES